MRRLYWLLPATLLLQACPPPIDVNDAGIAIVGPNGGIFVFQNEGVGIDVPKGALETESQITVTVIDTGIPEVPGRKRISFGYRLSPSTLSFKAPIKLFLPWQADRVPKGVDPGTFDMRRQSSTDPYLALNGVTVRTEYTNVEAQSDRLGLFWLTSPSTPNVATLNLDPTEAFLQVGGTQQFTAEVKDPAGGTLEVSPTWSSVPPRVGTISDGGLFTALAPGWATVTVTAGMMTETAQIKVQGSAVGPTTFVHENPFPTGNDLWGGTVLPGSLGTVFVGANGTVLLRDQAGAWSRLFSSPGIVLKAVAGTTLQNAVAVGNLGTTGVLVELSGTTPTLKTFTTIDPRALWFDGTHGMAVGYGNDVLVRRATGWVKEYSPSVETLLSVVGDGAGNFVTVGSRGSIYRYDATTQTWDSLYQTQLSVLLTAAVLVGNDGQEAWAASINKLWHFSGGTWSATNLPAAPPLNEVTTLGLVDHHLVLGARYNKEGFAFLYDLNAASADGGSPGDGGTDGGSLEPGWSVITLRTPQIPRGFVGADLASTTGYLLGEAGALYSWTSGSLTELSKGFYGDVAAVSVVGTDVFAAVNECAASNCATRVGAVYRRAGPGAFELLGGAPQPFGAELSAIAARSPTEVVVATTTAVYRWDGAAWSALQVTGGVIGTIQNLRFCGNTLFGVGLGGSFYRGTQTALARQPSVGTSDLYSVACPIDTELWAAGDGILATRVGQGAWALRSSMTVDHAAWRATWSPGPGEAFAFGDARYGVYWNTAELLQIDSPGGVSPDIVSGMWGSSIDNLYLVGVTNPPVVLGMALRFDGAQFTLVDSGSQRAVTAIDGSAPLEVWLGTKGGGLLRGVKP